MFARSPPVRSETMAKVKSSSSISKVSLVQGVGPLCTSCSNTGFFSDMVLQLTKEVAALSVKVEYLTKENEMLNKKRTTSTKGTIK